MRNYNLFRFRRFTSLTTIALLALASLVAPAASAATVVGPGTYENDNPAIVYSGSWSTTSSAKDSGGSYAMTYSTVASASLTFTGTSISWISRRTAASGIAGVAIDGAQVATVDRYSATGQFQQVVWETKTLAPGTHTITVTGSSAKNPAATGNSTIVDAFIVPINGIVENVTAELASAGSIEVAWTPTPVADLEGYRVYRSENDGPPTALNATPTTATTWRDTAVTAGHRYSYIVRSVSAGKESPDSNTAVITAAASTGTYDNTSPALLYSGAWSTVASSNDDGGSSAVTYSSQARVAFTFEGSSAQWISRLSPTSGIARVAIDGTVVATVDRYASSNSYKKVVWETRSLDPGTHTIEIISTGSKNAAATGNSTIVDALVVPINGIVTNVTATASANGGVDVAWSPTSVSGLTGYRVYRSKDGGEAVRFAETAGDVTSVSDTSTAPGSNYSYSVTSMSQLGESPRSTAAIVYMAASAGTYDQTNSAVEYSGSWKSVASSNDLGGTSAVTYSSSAKATFSFTGSGVQWLSRYSPSSGISKVYVDGALTATVDRYRSTSTYQVPVWEVEGLGEGRHTVVIESTATKNAAATGNGTVIDGFRVQDPGGPDPLAGLTAAGSPDEVILGWNAVTDESTQSVRVYGASSASASFLLLTTLPRGENRFVHKNVRGPATYRYYLRAVDHFGLLGEPTPTIDASVDAARVPDYNTVSECPSATKTVSTTAALTDALATAKAGDVVRLAPAVYKGRFSLTGAIGSAEAPIWICGEPGSVMRGWGTSGGSTLTVRDSSFVTVTGFEVTNSLKGVTVEGSDHVTVSNLNVHTSGEEGIHLLAHTTDSIIAGNRISDTGSITPEYGEGVYVGSWDGNWCTYSDCQPDASNNNVVTDNDISDTTAEAIDVKEGAIGGRITFNRIDGALTTSRGVSDKSISIRSNNWFVGDNSVNHAPAKGISVSSPPTLGYPRDVHALRNSISFTSTGIGISVGTNSSTITVACKNTVAPISASMSNRVCLR